MHARDAWFVGFSSALVVGVWVGFEQPKSIGKTISGASVALPIWIDFMRQTTKLFPPRDFVAPDAHLRTLMPGWRNREG